MRIVVAAGFVAAAGSGGAAGAQDAEAGFDLFQQQCRTCHVVEEGDNRLGPHLQGVVGREVGAVEGFAYSDSLASAGRAWDEALLDAFIENPNAVFPGNGMLYPGMPSPEDRAALIAYLAEQG